MAKLLHAMYITKHTYVPLACNCSVAFLVPQNLVAVHWYRPAFSGIMPAITRVGVSTPAISFPFNDQLKETLILKEVDNEHVRVIMSPNSTGTVFEETREVGRKPKKKKGKNNELLVYYIVYTVADARGFPKFLEGSHTTIAV